MKVARALPEQRVGYEEEIQNSRFVTLVMPRGKAVVIDQSELRQSEGGHKVCCDSGSLKDLRVQSDECRLKSP